MSPSKYAAYRQVSLYAVQYQIQRGNITVDSRGMIDSDIADAAWTPMKGRVRSETGAATAVRARRVNVATQRIKAATDKERVDALLKKHWERSEVVAATQLVIARAFAEIARLPDAGAADLAAELECEPEVAKAILDDARAAIMQELDGYEEELKKILGQL